MTILEIECRAKINLYLLVTARRPDGYHEIETLLQEIDLADRLLWEPGGSPLQLIVHNTQLGDPAKNLVYRAAMGFAELSRRPVGGRVSLYKNIPAGGGLGGGSSDAAGMLKLLNRYYQYPLGESELLTLCGELGSDVPFFLRGGTQIGKGRGEQLSPEIGPFCHQKQGFLFFPPLPLATADVFRACRPLNSRPEPGRNDLLEAALAVSPEFASIWASLGPHFPEPFFMTGSGSTLVWLTASDELSATQKEVLENQEVRFLPFSFL